MFPLSLWSTNSYLCSRVDSVESGYFTDLTGGGDDISLTPLERILHQEEDALAELERLVAGERSVLVGSEPEQVLDGLQRIEQVLGTIGQLEAARTRLSQESGIDADGTPGIDMEMAARATYPSASAQFWAIRHRILSAIARIAQRNEANRQLLFGLARVTGNAIDRLQQLQQLNVASNTHHRNERGTWLTSVALDVKA